MRSSERLALGLTLCASQWVAAPARAEEALFRWRAPVEVRQAAAFVQLPLPVSAYGHSQQHDLQDLRIVDARGERVPFALLVPGPSAQRDAALDPAVVELLVAASPEPVGATPPRGGLHFDLGGALPLVQLDLQLAAGTLVAPVQLEGRRGVDEPWRELTRQVFHHIERDATVSRSPPVQLQATVRYVRVVPDPRTAALDAAATRLAVHARLASVVFAMQGEPPFTLLAGSSDAPPSALPVSTLLPALAGERARFGQATLGAWDEVPAVVRQADAEQRRAQLRPWLLWSVLLVGVGSLGLMVWRLTRGRAR
jgi:hypothetical protein